ncbi:Golgi-specific brefeldin A-resistance guanine nucleotide exchange factor 1-like isoform X3 [Stylophora pistillata]|uniref:Golgi-specific brefeldin A-resistance guanine nucleotide exchange factor 1-like isoform X3 n=1 Tax=Stylophora pistillata TaxID=50429 RepID=UPI000C046562|nr:Golgi-specific brefeldin A-resistance guanine nucleotide exchange factor 1-like isoform X3 [Stylophora pistillata]
MSKVEDLKQMSTRNGVYIVQGEMSLVVAALRRNVRGVSHSHQDEEQDPLLHGFSQLKDQLVTISDLSEIDVNTFLGPFLDVIRSEDTTGPVTGVALSSVNKFLSYGLVDPASESAASGIENLADAVTHARFVGTDPSSDEVVLMKILQVLRTLLLTPVGAHMTNESVCEIMQSCFRICFETRLSELLRRSAEQTLMDMVQLLFSRLPQFKEELKSGMVPNIRKVFKRAGAMATGKRKKHMSPKPRRGHLEEMPPTTTITTVATTTTETSSDLLKEDIKHENVSETDPTLQENIIQESSKMSDCVPEQPIPNLDTGKSALNEEEPSIASQLMSSEVEGDGLSMEGVVMSEDERDVVGPDIVASSLVTEDDGHVKELMGSTASLETVESEDLSEAAEGSQTEAMLQQDDYVNPRGVRFTPQEPVKEGAGPLIPYGLPCIRELFRFLISLINPHDRHNSEAMIHMGLSLLTVALESGSHHIGTFPSLMNFVKDDMCKNLFWLIQCDVLGLFTMAMRVCFLLFEGLRTELKFQMEMFFKKLMDILSLDPQIVPYEKRELTLDAVNQLFRVPNLVMELYLNYDCDVYSTNVFEELCKLLSKNAFPSAGSLYSVHILSLDALLAVVQNIEEHCHSQLLNTAENSTDQNNSEKCPNKTTDDDSGIDDKCDSCSLMSPPSPPTSGFAMAKQMTVGVESQELSTQDSAAKSCDHYGDDKSLNSSLGLLSSHLPAVETLAKLRQRKKILQAGTEQFNNKAKKGIEFLQEQGLLSSPLNPEEMAKFLRENPRLDKKTIGDYLGDKKNTKVLEAFVRSFHFHDLRVDEALRSFLESFRLPGESPVIEHIIEFFSELFYEGNPEPYANKDAVFTLCYAVIMLNVDQHNSNIKQQKPMTCEEFKKNLRKTNGTADFKASMLEEVYHAIRNEEIVMPSERSGKIRENYDWKVLLRRSSSPEGKYMHGLGSSFDKDLFLIIWGPTVAALSYVYDNGLEKSVAQKAIVGFRKCALISAHYSLSDVFDNLVISLCKFTALLTPPETGESLSVSFGRNLKSQQSARTLFALAHRHGDILREGWKNIMDCMLQLFKAKLLPKSMVEAEDFVEASGRVSLLPEELPLIRQETSIFSWWFVNPEPASYRGQTTEDKEAQKQAHTCIRDCHPELLITESKFLRPDSLNELIKVLIYNSSIENQESVPYDEEAAVFFLELLIRVVLENRDRVSALWATVRDHLSNILVNATHHSSIVERSVVGLLRLAIRLLHKEEVSSQVLLTLRILLLMKHDVLQDCGRQISFGLHELIRTNASSITCSRDWVTVFALLECVGAAASLPTVTSSNASMSTASSDVGSDLTSRDYELADGISTSESDGSSFTSIEADSGLSGSVLGDTWLLITKQNSESSPANQYELTVGAKLNKHDSKSFVKSCQSLAFLIRDNAHVTKENYLHCVHALRLFSEASLNGGAGYRQDGWQFKESTADYKGSWGRSNKKTSMSSSRSKKVSPTGLRTRKSTKSATSSPATSEDEAEIVETINNTYDAMSLQLLELMYTLHTHGRGIFDKFQDERNQLQQSSPDVQGNDQSLDFLWTKCWCPLLQGIARLCCDMRRDVRMSALTYLQRALLVQDLQNLSAMEWEACFNKVLFPMLSQLLEVNSKSDPMGVEETRMRAATLLCKVFLQHLTPLLSLSTFTALWLTILEFMDKYMHADKSDLLYEAIPESLKNMLLVMSTAGIFDEEECALTAASQSDNRKTPARPQSDVHKYSALWQVTWERIDCFLPNLRQELFTPRCQSPVSNIPKVKAEQEKAVSEECNRSMDLPGNVGKPDNQDKQDNEQSSPSKSTNSSISSPPGGGQQQVCVVLQPPLPSLANRSTSPTHLGSLADNVRPSSVPIILAPSPALSSAGLSSPQGSRSPTPTDPTPKQLEMSEDDPKEDLKADQSNGESGSSDAPSPERTKASIYDI